MSSPKTFRRRIYRKRSLSHANHGSKQNATPFFDFGPEQSFFSGNTKEAAIHRQNDTNEKEKDNQKLQRTNSASSAHAAPVNVSSYVKSLNGTGSALPAQTRHFFEPKFGADFSKVRVHNDQESAEMASSIHAKAFTHKNHVVFNKGQYDTDSTKGKQLLSHELTHVIQQDNSIKRTEIEHNEEEKLQKKESVSKSINSRVTSSNPEIQRKPIKDIVNDYKNTFKKQDPDILTFGQFYCTNKLKKEIKEYFNKIIQRSLDVVKNNKVRSDFDRLINFAIIREVSSFETLQKSLRSNLHNDPSFNLGNDITADLLSLIGTSHSQGELKEWGLWTYVKAWEQIKKKMIPKFESLCKKKKMGFSLTSLLALCLSEALFCGGTAERVIGLFYKQKGLKLRGIYLPLKGNKNIKKNIQKLKNFLDTGAITYARLLSGNTKHSIVIIGYEGDKFVFWDPDVVASSLQVNGVEEEGFGWLMHNEIRGFLVSNHNKYRVLFTQ